MHAESDGLFASAFPMNDRDMLLEEVLDGRLHSVDVLD